jgi:general secretion pathway protein L
MDWLFWWLATLRQMLSLGLKGDPSADNIITIGERAISLSLVGSRHEFDAVISLASHLSEHQERGRMQARSFVIRFEKNSTIVRKLAALSLPESRHRAAAVLDMEASTPFRITVAYAMPVKLLSSKAGAYYAIVKRTALDPIVEALQKVRADVGSIEFEDHGQSFVLSSSAKHLLPTKSQGVLSRVSIAALALCGLLVPLTFAHSLYRYDNASAQLDTLIEPLGEKAKTVRLELDKRAKRIAELETMRKTIEDRKPAIAIWEELARVLPDSSFLTDLSITQDKVSIAGYSQSATAIIVALEGSGIFDEVSFTAPVVKVPGRTDDRFSIALKIGVK